MHVYGNKSAKGICSTITLFGNALVCGWRPDAAAWDFEKWGAVLTVRPSQPQAASMILSLRCW